MILLSGIPYEPKREPQPHQVEALRRSWDKTAFALFMEQRTRKTKVILDNASVLYEQGKIDALIIVAMPGRVHANWIKYEIPQDLPDRIERYAVVWDAGRVGRKSFKNALEWLIDFKGLAILAVNGEAVITETFRAYLKRFLDRRKAMVVADEHTLIMKTPGTKRTKVMQAIGRHRNVIAKRILDGTPVGEGPLDLYAPFTFLDPKILGFTSFFAFKHRYAKWKTERNFRAGYSYEVLDRGKDNLENPYINLDELQAKISQHSYRITRKELGRSAEKVYQPFLFQLSPLQRKAYDELEQSFETELANGANLSARHALTRLLRLQQLTSNYWPPERVGLVHAPCAGNGCEGCDDLGVVEGFSPLRVVDPDHNPRLEALRDVLELNRGVPTIVWARFHQDVDAAVELSRALGRSPVQYDGRTPPEAKDAAQSDFQSGRALDLIGNPRSGGRGVRLDRARLIVYLSNEFSLLSRLQSEDRAEDLDKLEATGVVDLIAEDTIDDRLIVPALHAKKSLTDYVLGEKGGKWL